MRLHRAAVAGLLGAGLLMPGATAVAQNLGPGRGQIERGPVDVEQMVQRSALIVHGFVAKKEAKWVGRVLYTQYELVVQETLKGTERNSVLVSVVGGRSGNVELKVPGAPDLSTGDQLVFFGSPLAGDASFTPVGTFDGVVPISQGRGNAAPTVAPRGREEPLTDFLQEVRAVSKRR